MADRNYFRAMAFTLRPFMAATLVLAVSAVMAQGRPPKPKVVLYQEGSITAWDTVDCVRNVLKVNPLLFLKGEIPIYYERILSEHLSVELAAGITSRNYIGTQGNPTDAFGAGTEIITRPAFHAGFRWYLKPILEPEGLYLQAEFAYAERAKDIVSRDDSGRFTDVRFRDERIYNDVRAYFGFQRLAGNSNWLYDAYVGLGYRTRAIDAVNEHYDPIRRQWGYSLEHTNDQVLVPFLGIKVGYGF